MSGYHFEPKLPSLDVFMKCLPEGWTAHWGKQVLPDMSLDEPCFYTDYNIQTVYVPYPSNVGDAWIFLHECGHAHLHREQCRGYLHDPALMEYEAEIFARDACDRLGIKVPLSILERSRQYITHFVHNERRSGRSVAPHVSAYANGYGPHGLLQTYGRHGILQTERRVDCT